MYGKFVLSLVFLLVFTFMASCSGGSENIVTPDPGDRNVVAEAGGGTIVMGLWQIIIDTKTGTGDIVQLRSADKIINVLGFMEPPALSLMGLDNLVVADPIVEVGIILEHPIAGDAVFTGFDVRGICFGPEVTNADGLTVVCSPEYFTGVPFGYQDGLLGAPDSYGDYSGLAGYKYFCDDLDATDDLAEFFSDPDNLAARGSYGSGETNQRDYVLDWTDSGQAFLVFNYAIYANYEWPVGDPPVGLDHFEITDANSAEAFCFSVTETANSLWYSEGVGGGSISLDVEIWDWLGDITIVSIESKDPGIIAESFFDVYAGPGGTDYSYVYQFTDVPGDPAVDGDLDIIITATDVKTFGEAWFMELLDTGNSMYGELVYNSFLYTTTVIECPVPTITGTYMGAGIIDDKSIYGTNFIDGTSLAVTLTDGITDYVGDDVTFVSDTEITADFDLTGAAFGDILDIEVINGCGTEGLGAGAWEVYYLIHDLSGPHVVTPTPYRDIACNPAADQVCVTTGTGNAWTRYSDDYTTSSNMTWSWYGNKMRTDGNDWGMKIYNQMGSSTQFPIYSAEGWDNSNGSNWWYGQYCTGGREMWSQIGNNRVWGLYDFSTYGYYYIMYFTGVSHSSSVAWVCFSPFYNGSGTTGVVSANVLAADAAPYTSGYQFYFLEVPPGSIERYNMASSPTYQYSLGATEVTNPRDLSVDTGGFVYVLDVDTGGEAHLWMYEDGTGDLAGYSGAIPSTLITVSGELRIDAYLYSDPDEIHVLHGGGVTRFTAY